MIKSLPLEKRTWTEEELAALPNEGYNHEVVDGRLVLSPKNNPEHGEICMRLSSALSMHVQRHKLGALWDSSTGFWMSNGNCRAPDISFISKQRLAGLKRPPKRFFRGAPDLAIEILAPSNTSNEFQARLHDYFTSGTRVAWVIDPETRTAAVYHGMDHPQTLGLSGVLQDEQYLPGFRFPVADLFAEWDWD
jgi:Uma2 family endonuclease